MECVSRRISVGLGIKYHKNVISEIYFIGQKFLSLLITFLSRFCAEENKNLIGQRSYLCWDFIFVSVFLSKVY